MNQLQTLMERMKALEQELAAELQKKEQEFFYRIRGRKVIFDTPAAQRHRQLGTRVLHFLLSSSVLNILTAPIIWACLIPTVLLDAAVTLYQVICFRVYGIPRVRRRDYVVIDHQFLAYLNWLEKVNCLYCSYANGIIAYAQEIAARTEQYWCPIKHAHRLLSVHSRYHKFIEYGDAETYRTRLEQIRRDFGDLDPSARNAPVEPPPEARKGNA